MSDWLASSVCHCDESGTPAAGQHVAAALLPADGDRLPADTTVNMGSTAIVPGVGMGVAQEYSFLASAPTSKLPVAIGAPIVEP